jgi:hypothetical protein
MPHDIRLIHINDFLRTHASGTIDLETSKQVLRDIVAACREHPNHNVLIDSRETTNHMSALEVWQVAASLEKSGLDPEIRLAIVNDPKDAFDRADFFETCAANRGFNIRAFRDFEKALYWLAPHMAPKK